METTNKHFAICETCGYTTNSSRNDARSCPKGHGVFLIIDHKYAKLINKKGDTGEDRLRKLRLLQKQWRVNDEEKRFGRMKRIGTGIFISQLELFLHPHMEKIQ